MLVECASHDTTQRSARNVAMRDGAYTAWAVVIRAMPRAHEQKQKKQSGVDIQNLVGRERMVRSTRRLDAP